MDARIDDRVGGNRCPRSGIWTAPFWTVTVRSPTTATSPTDIASWPPPWAWRWTPTCSPSPAGRSSSRSTRRFGATADGAATTPTRFTSSAPSIRRAAIASAATRATACTLLVTAYNEPSPGAWSDRIVAIIRDTDLDINTDGNFSFEFPVTPDAAVLRTRDYQAHPQTGRTVGWRIEALDELEPIRHGDTETAASLRAATAWMRIIFAIVPLAVGDACRLGARPGARNRPPR